MARQALDTDLDLDLDMEPATAGYMASAAEACRVFPACPLAAKQALWERDRMVREALSERE